MKDVFELRNWKKFDENMFIVHLVGEGDPELCYGYQMAKKESKEKLVPKKEMKL
jgi:hypothetical protein